MEDFGSNGVVVVSDEMQINLEMAKCASSTEFLSIVKKQVDWQREKIATPARITTQEELQAAVQVFDEMKRTLNELEKIRLAKVAFPTKIVNMINGLFRQVKIGIRDSKDFIGGKIAKKQAEDQAEYERKKREFDEEQERIKKAAEQIEQESTANSNSITTTSIPAVQRDFIPATRAQIVEGNESGVGRLQFGPVVPVMPSNVIESGRGAKVQSKADIEVEVVNLKNFLKVCISESEKNAWLGEHLEEIVEINLTALRKVLKANERKRKVEGLEIRKTLKII